MTRFFTVFAAAAILFSLSLSAEACDSGGDYSDEQPSYELTCQEEYTPPDEQEPEDEAPEEEDQEDE